MISEVRATVRSFGEMPLKLLEVVLGRAVESLFPVEYRQEIEVHSIELLIYWFEGHFKSHEHFHARFSFVECFFTS